MQALSCQPSEHEKAVLRLQSERRESAKALRAATDELAAVLAERLTSAMPPSEHLLESAHHVATLQTVKVLEFFIAHTCPVNGKHIEEASCTWGDDTSKDGKA